VLECDSRRGFELDIGLIDHFNAQLIIILNYSVIANFHTLQFIRAHAKCFPVHSVFTSSCLVTAPNNCFTSASALKSFLNGGYLPTTLFFRVTLRGAVYRQSVRLGAEPLKTDVQFFFFFFFFTIEHLGHSPYVTFSLTRGWHCRLQLLLALARTDILRSESRRIHDHILLSQIRDSLNLEPRSPYLYSPGTLWPSYNLRALGSLYVAFYD
jgi:hypothetical protein